MPRGAAAADAHTRRLTGSLAGVDVPKYENGSEQRSSEIDVGATRPAAEILVDLKISLKRLEDVLAQCSLAGWPHGDLRGGGDYEVAGCPAHRLREVEMHHVDLGLGYSPLDWPDEYVAWDLPVLLATVPERLGSTTGRRTFMAWLAGRGPLAQTPLEPW